MTMKTRIAAAVAAAAIVLGAGIAAAQNYSLAPAYGTLNLSAGFTPDPQVVNVQAGGNRSAQALSSSCQGFIANAPDVRLNYQAGGYQLMISADSSADTTLVINGPDGSWYCDDDGGNNGLNPLLRFNNPGSGQYDIWIGTYSSGSLQPAQLYISEIGSR
ncbi:MAG: peptidase S1 [Hyphomonadaceae bacterium]